MRHYTTDKNAQEHLPVPFPLPFSVTFTPISIRKTILCQDNQAFCHLYAGNPQSFYLLFPTSLIGHDKTPGCPIKPGMTAGAVILALSSVALTFFSVILDVFNRGSSVVVFAAFRSWRRKTLDPRSGPVLDILHRGVGHDRNASRRLRAGLRPGPVHAIWWRGLSERSACPERSEGTLNQRPTTYKKQILHCVQNDNFRFFLGAPPGRQWFWVLLPKQKDLVVRGRNPAILLLPSSPGRETPHLFCESRNPLTRPL